MATTTPTERMDRRPMPLAPLRLLSMGLAGLACVGASQSAGAEGLRFTPALAITTTATDNVLMAGGSASRFDLVTSVSPRLLVNSVGSAFKMEGIAGAELLYYLRGSADAKLWPDVHLRAQAKLTDRLLTVEGSFAAAATAADPLRSLSDSAVNKVLQIRETIAPVLRYEVSPDQTLMARSDNSFLQTKQGVVPGLPGNAFFQNNIVSYDLRPRPFGFKGEFVGSQSQFLNVPGSGIFTTTMRANALFAATPELTLGAELGTDRGQFTTNDVSQRLVGGTVLWEPTPRTRLEGRVERRFFGRGYEFSITHRSPYVVLTGELHRMPVSYASQVAVLQAGANVNTLLDAALRTRIPYGPDRAVAVQNLIDQRGLPVSLANSSVLYSGVLGLRERTAASAMFIGSVNTLTVRVFKQRNEDLIYPTDSPPPVSGDAWQQGVTTNLSHRLNSQHTASVSTNYVEVRGFGPNLGRNARALNVRLTMNKSVNNRTSLTGGVRVQRNQSNSTLYPNATEHALFAGVNHRF